MIVISPCQLSSYEEKWAIKISNCATMVCDENAIIDAISREWEKKVNHDYEVKMLIFITGSMKTLAL